MPSGSCICGDISYTFSDEPLSKVLCHCLLCKKLTGSAFLTGYTLKDPAQAPAPDSDNPAETKASSKPGGFTWKSKSNADLRTSTGLQESGVTMTFFGCSRCPSTLYKTCKDGFPGIMILQAGSLDGEYKAKADSPAVEFWIQHRLPWLGEIAGAKQFQAFT